MTLEGFLCHKHSYLSFQALEIKKSFLIQKSELSQYPAILISSLVINTH